MTTSRRLAEMASSVIRAHSSTPITSPSFTGLTSMGFPSGPDGRPIAVSPVKEGEVMGVEECARITLAAIVARKREVVMTFRGKMGLFLKLIAPGLVDRIARRAIEKGR